MPPFSAKRAAWWRPREDSNSFLPLFTRAILPLIHRALKMEPDGGVSRCVRTPGYPRGSPSDIKSGACGEIRTPTVHVLRVLSPTSWTTQAFGVVPRAGFEPAWPFGRHLLRMVCMHSTTWAISRVLRCQDTRPCYGCRILFPGPAPRIVPMVSPHGSLYGNINIWCIRWDSNPQPPASRTGTSFRLGYRCDVFHFNIL